MTKKIFIGKKVAVIGAARSGVACANLLSGKGIKVFLSDNKPKSEINSSEIIDLSPEIETEFGGHSEKILKYDSIIVSPGVPLAVPIIQKSKSLNIPIYSELDVAFSMINPKQVVAVTGTNGKTTTTTLVGEIFNQKTKTSGEHVVVGGNIGTPLSKLVDKIDGNTIVVLEISSYQLELSTVFHADIAAILNITPDHIERHKTMEEYIRVKSKIFGNQTKQNFSVLNYDDQYCRKIGEITPGQTIYFSQKEKLNPGVYYYDRKIQISLGQHNYDFILKTNLPGAHNRENILSAVSIGVLAGINLDDIINVLSSFKGVEHRLELVSEIREVKYINDSKATNVDSTKVALESFDQPIILIAGGRDKGAPYIPLQELVKGKVKQILLIGEASEKIFKELGSLTKTTYCSNLSNAVKTAYETASSGDVVLFSPACASFDQFDNYEHRGKVFKELVNKLK